MAWTARNIAVFEWLSPWMLSGLFVCLIPILIHLFFRRQYRTEPWAAMRFLRAAIQKQSRRIRLESLLMMILRTLVLALVVLAAAEPVFHSGTELKQRGSVQWILVLDSSLSMESRADGMTAFERARRELLKIVDDAVPGDLFNLIRISTLSPRTIVRRPTLDREDFRRELEQLQPTAEYGDVLQSLEQVLDLLEEPTEVDEVRVVVASDLQRSNWEPSDPAARKRWEHVLKTISEKARLGLLGTGQEGTFNLSIIDLQSDRYSLAPQQAFSVSATIRCTSDVATQGRMEWLVNDRVVDVSDFETIPGRDLRLQVQLPGVTSQAAQVLARITTRDQLLGDNQRYLSIPVHDTLRVLLVEGRPDSEAMQGATDYLAAALSPPETSGLVDRAPRMISLETTKILDAELFNHDLSRIDCLWLCDVPRLSPEEAQQLRNYVQWGGGLIISVGDQVDVQNYNTVLGDAGFQLLPGSLNPPVGHPEQGDERFAFEMTSPVHPVVQAFEDHTHAGLVTTIQYRYMPIELSEEKTARPIVLFTNGSPAIVEHRVGLGHVILIATSVDDRWGIWPVWPSFVPMVHELALFAAKKQNMEIDMTVGDPIVQEFAPSRFDHQAILVDPAGERHTLNTECNQQACRFLFTQTDKPGFYTWSWENGTPAGERQTFAVNIDPRESRLARLQPDEVEHSVLADIPHHYDVRWKPDSLKSRTTHQPGRLAGLFLMTAALLFLIEQVMAYRFLWGIAALVASGITVAMLQAYSQSGWVAVGLALTIGAAGILLGVRLRRPA